MAETLVANIKLHNIGKDIGVEEEGLASQFSPSREHFDAQRTSSDTNVLIGAAKSLKERSRSVPVFPSHERATLSGGFERMSIAQDSDSELYVATDEEVLP